MVGIRSIVIYLMRGDFEIGIRQYIVDAERKVREVIGATKACTTLLKAIYPAPILKLLVEVGESGIIEIPTDNNRIRTAIGMLIEKFYLRLLYSKSSGKF